MESTPKLIGRTAVAFAMLTVLTAFSACEDTAAPGADARTPPPPDGGLVDRDAEIALDAPDAAAFDDGATGPVAQVVVRTNTDPFPHADGYAGQTSRDAYQGIRSFELLRGIDDPDPLVLFDHGDDPVEAGYNDGDDTLVGMVRLHGLRAGHYTMARSVVTHSRYRVDAVMHAGGYVLPGEFDNVQVLSDGTRIDGVIRPESWFRYVFRTGGMDFPLEGLGAPLPTEPTTTGGFSLSIEDGVAAYYYPVDITLVATATEDLVIVLEVNMFEAFRWEDQDLPGYTAGVFDSSPTASEPVRRFGANSLRVHVE